MERMFVMFGFTLLTCMLAISMSSQAGEGKVDLGGGFFDLGVCTPVSNHRGTVATVDGDGNNVALVWLFDHRGGYGQLMVNVETGEAETFPTPFPPGGDTPYSSILSTGNKYYTHFNSHFCEFDPTVPGFTFHQQTTPQMAMGMTEDDDGVIWSVTYPNSGVVSFDPKTRKFTDYGTVHDENWRQYQRYVATDDQGWLYFGIGSTNSAVIAFNPETRKATMLTPADERVTGAGYVKRAMDGKVYGHMGKADNGWYVFYEGKATKLGKEKPDFEAKPIITSHQGLFHKQFPDGTILASVDLLNRKVTTKKPDGKTHTVDFDYESEGAHAMGCALAPGGTICGGTAFPMSFFQYDPEADEWTRRPAYGQWNTVVKQNDRFFVGGYGGGFLLECGSSNEWVKTTKSNEDSNPLFITQCTPNIHRPHDLLAHPDGKTIVLAGTPGYGRTGGGLLFFDRQTRKHEQITHEQIVPQLSVRSLVALPGGKLLLGMTTSPGTGGEVKADEACLVILDMATKKVEWKETVFPGIKHYFDMIMGPDGLVYGDAEGEIFFVFDPKKREVVHKVNIKEKFEDVFTAHQGSRVFFLGPNKKIYALLRRSIYRIEPGTFEWTLVSKSPVGISNGGDIYKGRMYFVGGSHMYSYDIPELPNE